MMHTEDVRPITMPGPEEWLMLWGTVWFALPTALASGFDRRRGAMGVRHARIPNRPGPPSSTNGIPGTGMGHAPAAARVGTRTFGAGTSDPDPLEALQAGCFA
ncbi:hypothetical protein DK427_20225 [Methylobacterium radiodurans]|uniref:Uncharacterized protein n=1 Tax=Methylobacterium radiodurans TaxID=2202828 RepID=A0A2U8VVJ2_9HYPH|nr:hypothetical protein DK427_20225 [Methylobacterium radiodurans]